MREMTEEEAAVSGQVFTSIKKEYEEGRITEEEKKKALIELLHSYGIVLDKID